MSLTKKLMNLKIFQYIGRSYVKYRTPQVVVYDEMKKLSKVDSDYQSQFGQDYFVYNLIFNGKNDGFMLEIGANDPVFLSNSFFFEKKGWTGLAFEPTPEICAKWVGARKMECLNNAVGHKSCEVSFTVLENSYGSGISDVVADKGEVIKVKQVTVSEVLKERNINHVDFASVDVEGYEMQVLEGIDFDKYDITCFSIENNKYKGYLPDEKIRDYMIKSGYVFYARIGIDDIFVKKAFYDKELKKKQESIS